MDPTSLKVLLSGSKKDDPIYVDDVFSTFLYDGNGSSQTITNDIDLAGEGGLLWIKKRSGSQNHCIQDTEQGLDKYGLTNASSPFYPSTSRVTGSSSTGFTIANDSEVNENGNDYVSWTFRKAPGFFDVVTYTGNGVVNRAVAHSLGSTPGCIIVKSTSASGQDWHVWHRSLNPAWTGGTTAGDTTGGNSTGTIYLNSTNAFNSSPGIFTYVNDTAFGVYSTNLELNSSGVTYVAYIFAHDDASFGTDGDEAIIKCGSWTASGGAASINLGFEPQFVITKIASGTGAWFLFDSMRGMVVGGNDAYLRPDTSDAEYTASSFIEPTSTGFNVENLGSSQDFIYMAIRRPHKPPTNGTEVFNTSLWAGTGSRVTTSTGFPVDLSFSNARDIPGDYLAITDRVRGSGQEFYGKGITKSTNVGAAGVQFDLSTGLEMQTYRSVNGKNYFSWNFKRAPGFFDIVPYDGTGSTTPHQHGLGVVPELMLVKCTTNDEDWAVYAAPTGPTKAFTLNTTSEAITSSLFWNNTAPTASGFTVGNYDDTNASGRSYINYLFATLPGISKVGSYNGTGSNIDVDCGFTAGARFVLIKCVEYIFNPSIATGWFVWDSARGINSGNEPWIFVNESTGEVTSNDYIDPINSGFRVTSSGPPALNASGYSYIFLAIA